MCHGDHEARHGGPRSRVLAIAVRAWLACNSGRLINRSHWRRDTLPVAAQLDAVH